MAMAWKNLPSISADLSSVETLETNLHGRESHQIPLAEITATKALALALFAVRYLGSLLVAKLVAANPGRYLNPAASSSITLTSGISAHRPFPGLSALNGVAGAVEVLSRSLAVDLAPIRVNVIIPGAVKTELLEDDGGKHGYFQGANFDETGLGFKIDNEWLLA
ncbi:hypothetical protein B0H19DRAFT_1248489 [Mycena capillaripes]|nr:hypothetical protein B0H19DRAFT_1248489 [Mycena capillaripes]